MLNSRHDKFILAPLLNILQEAVDACAGIGMGIESQALGEYVLQTTFLKMTGASEQKLKCICWEIATNDYTYRYLYLKRNYGECSSYKDKNSIYRDILDVLIRIDPEFNVDTLFEDIDISSKENEMIENKILNEQKKQESKKGKKLSDVELERLSEGIRKKHLNDEDRWRLNRVVLFESVQKNLEKVLNKSLVSMWEQHGYHTFRKHWRDMKDMGFAESEGLLSNDLKEFYEKKVYAHRNRCAHNLMSYQNNLPSLKTIAQKDYGLDNYFFRFSVLVLLDEIFVRLYQRFAECVIRESM